MNSSMLMTNIGKYTLYNAIYKGVNHKFVKVEGAKKNKNYFILRSHNFCFFFHFNIILFIETLALR